MKIWYTVSCSIGESRTLTITSTNMKRNLAGIVMLGVILGNIGINAEQWNKEHPLIYVAHAEDVVPKEVKIEIVYNWTPERIKQEAQEQAEKYNVPFKEMWDTILCESGASTTIQSHYVRKNGTREQSFGLAQIHLPDHNDVTYEQAIDPVFALNFMAKNWHNVRWYCRK